MAGIFIVGEEKIRPGSYFRIKKNGDDSDIAVINGVVAVIFRADFGPLGKAVSLSKDEGYEDTYGNAGTTDALKEAFKGGANTVIAVRLGNSGDVSKVTLKDDGENEVLTISTKNPGSKAFFLTVREKITNPDVKECIIYCGEKEFYTTTFAAGENEASALAEAINSSKNFAATIAEGKETALIGDISQEAFTGGSDPDVTVDDYSKAFELTEQFVYNTICVDTEDSAVHSLLYAFINRIYDNGLFTQGVIAEKSSLSLEIREQRAASYNDEKMCYILNPHVRTSYGELNGYRTAARLAGMIAAVSSNTSLTHTVINEFVDLEERLTPSAMTTAEKMGCIVLSMNSKDQVWIDNAITTLIKPPDNMDKGWQKIRRVKARFELLRRCNETTDNLVGKVDNDANGRLTIKSQLEDVCFNMRKEGKILSYSVEEDPAYKADGDSAWFILDVVDKDSAEHIYTAYGFQFSTSI